MWSKKKKAEPIVEIKKTKEEDDEERLKKIRDMMDDLKRQVEEAKQPKQVQQPVEQSPPTQPQPVQQPRQPEQSQQPEHPKKESIQYFADNYAGSTGSSIQNDLLMAIFCELKEINEKG